MPEFTITQQINAPVETVWEVLDDFGNIQRWSAGVKFSELTSEGPVAKGSTRHCDFTPMGSVDERIDGYEPNRRLTINLFETSRVPFSNAIADFNIAPHEGGTLLTLIYTYTPNLLGRFIRGTADKQLRKGMSVLAKNLAEESERMAASG